MQVRSCSLFRALNHRCDVCSWHLTDKPPAPEFVAYWTNNGQKAVLGLDLSAAIDPSATFATRDSGQKPTSCRIRYLVAPASKGRNKRLRSEAD